MKNAKLRPVGSYSDSEIKKAVDENLDRYDDLLDMQRHTKTISDLTQGRSGFFGIPFPDLLNYLERRIKNEVQ